VRWAVRVVDDGPAPDADFLAVEVEIFDVVVAGGELVDPQVERYRSGVREAELDSPRVVAVVPRDLEVVVAVAGHGVDGVGRCSRQIHREKGGQGGRAGRGTYRLFDVEHR